MDSVWANGGCGVLPAVCPTVRSQFCSWILLQGLPLEGHTGLRVHGCVALR